ncbi:uncharacterized protein LOC107261273 [Ricinus communis]|uniref:uncharacterized protein LOC107261273 n=1 Tax=Ricinus communis TaxID=3988 RepID=UPI000772931E|nr:uncharacterized protein LOC107261273 [Ricinus communis]|eukprot:XP_015574926.1 uncharacterized protein LOC107261273 [Ricinus communis]
MDAQTIILHLKEMFDEQSMTERYEISKELFRCKMAEGASVNAHGLKLLGYIEYLGHLGFVMDHELRIDLLLQSLLDSYSQFVMNFHMNKYDTELINMLKTVEGTIKKQNGVVLMVEPSKAAKSKSKKKGKRRPRSPRKP